MNVKDKNYWTGLAAVSGAGAGVLGGIVTLAVVIF